jgi:hypothetical protein
MNQIKNVPASVIQRLKNRCKSINRPLEYILLHYAIERFLYRMSQSKHRDAFVLKGGLACLTLDATFPRTTRDIDFLGYTENAAESVKTVIRGICQQLSLRPTWRISAQHENGSGQPLLVDSTPEPVFPSSPRFSGACEPWSAHPSRPLLLVNCLTSDGSRQLVGRRSHPETPACSKPSQGR